MPTVVVNRLEVEPAPPAPEEGAGAEAGEPAKEAVSPREVERALRNLEIRMARVKVR